MNPNESKSPLFNYYCTPFLFNNSNKRDYFFSNNFPENNEKNENIENDGNLYRNCPFEPYTVK